MAGGLKAILVFNQYRSLRFFLFHTTMERGKVSFVQLWERNRLRIGTKQAPGKPTPDTFKLVFSRRLVMSTGFFDWSLSVGSSQTGSWRHKLVEFEPEGGNIRRQ